MSAESKIRAALSGAAGVTALVSNRIKPGVLPQGMALPAIVFTGADADFVMTIHSSIPVASSAEVEIWCIAETFTAADAVGEAVIAAIGAAGIRPLGRRSEIDPETEAFSSVITCVVWP